ncbi:hypothetical protein EDC14_100622 [Hydrogenispora ethanolica]|jgi:hypothetical protein|uniref:Uncharacterized protein n=1 Tax=Hydrogenispora ethanolica TaxID=1082276 RepID=A0A4R1S0E7_HYDET|nr:hypothetical protein [Hydrogenispora ethanolica]TCL72314.1 hypothetical protein EDC14_100622 [Hydrogenispora ethanolica]
MPVKAKIRYDYKAETQGRRFFWQRHDPCQAAKEIRARQIALLRNLPFQGLNVTDLDSSQEVYVMPEAGGQREAAYAPVELTVEAESLEDLMQLTLCEEFRKIKVVEPSELHLSTGDVERLLFKMTAEYREELDLE